MVQQIYYFMLMEYFSVFRKNVYIVDNYYFLALSKIRIFFINVSNVS